MSTVAWILLLFLVICAAAACLSKKLLVSLVIFMGYSLIMSVIWVLLDAPVLAVTDATVGAGVTSILFFVTLQRLRLIDKKYEAPPAPAENTQEGAEK